MNEDCRNHDCRQYMLLQSSMLHKPENTKELKDLLDKIWGILKLIKIRDEDWIQSLSTNWWDMEEIIAVVLDENRTQFSKFEEDIIDGAYKNIRKLIEEKYKQIFDDIGPRTKT